MTHKLKIVIRGVVQGVGFRPFVYRLASEMRIKGWIINSSQGVFIEAEQDKTTLENFSERIRTEKPANSYIQSFESSWLDAEGFTEFEIRESREQGSKTALVLPDISTCPDCLKEIFDPTNRRYMYPFTNCTNCGPRYSIIADLPYDRCNTTMGEFEMCDDCRAEYTDPLNRRFHAEPTACPKCGPQVALLDSTGKPLAEKHDAVKLAAEMIRGGKIVALKGIGGYQLICDARSGNASQELRQRKRRSEKPFAMMFPDLKSVKAECEVSPEEEKLLCSVEAPIVLLKRKRGIDSVISEECAGANPYFGIMLPYSPLHHILMLELGFPVIATSGNISEEPICTNEEQAFEKLTGIADVFLVHNRKILRHVDDSITRVINGRQMMMRRARGYAPLPLVMDGLNGTVLAAGPHLKNTIAINKGTNVFVSQHIGDLENVESINAFKNVVSDITGFYELKPGTVICDMHPDYVSTRYADDLKEKDKNIQVHKVQHHYAHVLSCLAESGLDGEVLGVSWDGTGYGTDGTIWGGEFLISEGSGFRRAAHFAPFGLPGGEQAIHDVWKIGYSLLHSVYGSETDALPGIGFLQNTTETRLIKQMLEKNINSPVTTSAGRLFDGAAAIAGIRNKATFEAQAAMEFEFAAETYSEEVKTNDYFAFETVRNDKGAYEIRWASIISSLAEAAARGESKGLLALKFHNSIAEIIVSTAKLLNIKRVALTGGCFLNKLLLEKSISRLEEEGFKVYWHQRVPTGDGGISTGQMKFASYLK